MPTLDSLISGDSQKKHLKLLPIDLVLSLQLKSEQEELQIAISDSHSAKTKPSLQCGSVVNRAWIAHPRSLYLGKKSWHWPQIALAPTTKRRGNAEEPVSIAETALAVTMIGWRFGGWISKRNSCPIDGNSLQEIHTPT